MSARAAAVLGVWIAASALMFAQLPSDIEIRKILAERVGAENRGIAVVVGIVDQNGRRVISYGSVARNDPRKLDGNTVFEIGSMTKVFTSLVLMDMARHGEVSVTDPVSKYLPANVKVPERDGRKITLADLSTQSSGLPRMPTNFHPKDPDNPYADYSVQQMYDFLSGYELTRDPGAQYEYSNLAVGLLGHVLSLRAGMSYEAMVRSRICDPLGMKDTRVTLTPEMKARLAEGHSGAGTPVPNWDLPTLAGAGALRSTANDMLTFLAANLGYVKTPLAQDMADEVSIRRPTTIPDTQIAYAWHIQNAKDGSSILWHNGGTGGYRSYMGYDPKARVGVVALTNISTVEGADDLGRHLLNPAYPLSKVAPPAEHTEITLDSKILGRYVGTYRLSPYTLLLVSRDGERLSMRLGPQKIPIFAESERSFFVKVVDAQLTFDVDAQGAATGVTLHQNGANTVAKRLTGEEIERANAEIEAHKAEVAKRFKDQTPEPGSEASVRKAMEELRSGNVEYNRMSPGLAAATRQQLAGIQSMLAELGALQSVTFKRVLQNGADVYEVKFEHGSLEYTIVLGPNGIVQGAGLRRE